MPIRNLPLMLVCGLAAAAFALPSQAQMEKRGGPKGGLDLHYEVQPTGLTPVFPPGYTCDPIASPFGSPARFDGSTRRGDRNSGLHGGLDISLKEGTPLLAMASGTVLSSGEGGQLEGIYLWLLHTPADTGLPYGVIVKYQHLQVLPSVRPGDRIALGQVVALSGLTGTVGRAFGPKGYPHLHISLFDLSRADIEWASVPPPTVRPKDGVLSDPMQVFLPPTADVQKQTRSPEAAKNVPVAAMHQDGQVAPPDSKVIWPVACN